jgi:hypothetical protein
MVKILSLLVLLAVLPMASCFLGGLPSIPAATTAPAAKPAPAVTTAPAAPAAAAGRQQAVNFLKLAAPIQLEFVNAKKELDDIKTNESKWTMEYRKTRLTNLSFRTTEARSHAETLNKSLIPDAANNFYQKWLAMITSLDKYAVALAKGDFSAAEMASSALSLNISGSDITLSGLLTQFGITKAEVSWPS